MWCVGSLRCKRSQVRILPIAKKKFLLQIIILVSFGNSFKQQIYTTLWKTTFIENHNKLRLSSRNLADSKFLTKLVFFSSFSLFFFYFSFWKLLITPPHNQICKWSKLRAKRSRINQQVTTTTIFHRNGNQQAWFMYATKNITARGVTYETRMTIEISKLGKTKAWN